MTDQERDRLIRHLEPNEFQKKYKFYVDEVVGKGDGKLDRAEYSLFVNQIIKKDLQMICHGCITNTVDYNNTMACMRIIVGYDLMLQQLTMKTEQENNEDKKE